MVNLPLVLIPMLVIGVVFAAVRWIGRDAQRYRTLARVATALAFIVVVVGAFVRLTDAGLGCPDWPGCYGNLSPAHAQAQIAAREAVDPIGPVTMTKAWKEMIHRYIATTLGALIVALMVAAWRMRAIAPGITTLAAALVGVVLLQGAFGAWTVTLLLKPAIVTGHLVGGMLTLSLLLLLALVASPSPRFVDAPAVARLRPFALATLAIVALQIVLGGWTSTNYAALACLDYPTCRGSLVPSMDFAHGFQIVRHLGLDADGQPVTIEMLTAIHWTHRTFADVVALTVVVFATRLFARPDMRAYAIALFAAIGVQIALGIGNVVLGLPLPVAVGHNAGAACLLLLMVAINHRVGAAYRAQAQSRPGSAAASLAHA